MNYLNVNRNLIRNLFNLITSTTRSTSSSVVTSANCESIQATANNSTSPLSPEPVQAPAGAFLDDLYKKVIVEVRGHDPIVLDSYENFVKLASQELEVNLKSIRTPFRFIERWTILKSRFSNRKHMRQYEMRTHFKEFEFIHLTGSTRDTLLEYIQRNLPEGVAMHVHETKILELPQEYASSNGMN